VSLRVLAIAALSWGGLPTMCATTPEPVPPPAEPPFTAGPDGLPIRPAPLEEVEEGVLPAPASDEGEPQSEVDAAGDSGEAGAS
jgi:hypothetical protein